MINLRHIEVFHAIMRTGSITGAARMLNVTQPAVSASLKHFESRLKMKLFERAGGRLQPTPEAEALLPDIAEIFGRLGAVERLSRDLAGGVKGRLSIAATSPLANGYLAKAVATFTAKRPGVRVTLQSIASPLVLERVINREVDLGVAFDPVASSAVVTEELARGSIACVLPAKHPLAKKASIRVRDLVGHPVITYLPQAQLRPHIDRALDGKATLDIAVETGTSVTGIMLAYHGAGIALMESTLLSVLPLPGLVSRPLEPRIEVKSLLVRNRAAPPSRVVEDFVKHLRRTIA